MTRKRYIKLCYALMQKINQEYIKTFGEGAKGWNTVLKGIKKIEYKNIDSKYKSYTDAWDSLESIRKQYGM